MDIGRHENQKQSRIFWAWFFGMILIALMTSCVQAEAKPIPDEWHGVDPIFREYYRYLGGETVMGGAISPIDHEGTALVQYLERGKLVFDVDAPARQRFRLAPLGIEMALVEPPVAQPAYPDPYYVDGHNISPDFASLYEKLNILNAVGRPITEMKYNPHYKQYEQYFENLGFFRLEGTSEVRLLPYGVWACDQDCRSHVANKDMIPDRPQKIDPVFVPFVSRLGSDFTGFALTGAYVGREGKWEQIYENVVLVANVGNDPHSVVLRPLSKELKILSDMPHSYSHSPDKYFYSLEGDKGYEIPNYFWDYIASRGGLALFGAPISHLAPSNNAVVRQCFVNLCLTYDSRANENARVRPEPLGYWYKQLYYSPEVKDGQPKIQSAQDGTLTLQVWEQFPAVTSTQVQEIGVNVLRDNRPLMNVAPVLTLTLLDGNQQTFHLPPTGDDGQSRIQLPPIEAPNGTLILYQVCVPNPGKDEFCAEKSYVIWDFP